MSIIDHIRATNCIGGNSAQLITPVGASYEYYIIRSSTAYRGDKGLHTDRLIAGGLAGKSTIIIDDRTPAEPALPGCC